MQEGLHISLSPSQIGTLWGLPITSTLLTSWFVIAVLLIGTYFIGRSLKLVPGKGQVAVEGVVGFALSYMEETLEDKALARRYFPLITSIFLFILCANLVGLLPFVGPVVVHTASGEVPLLWPVNTDLNIPLALAIIAFIAIEFAGITVLGGLKYAKKFVNFKSIPGFFVGIIEFVSEIARL
ncbi:MAG: F0F1 ATP synthase subunit A, partial [Patescibacteria group bacterium]|nr:F0F1 ATP synthase subunit A [Patescibacteria group bacterium]